MTTPDKPIQEQVNRALNIFRDPFRDFVVRRLRTVRGRKPADVIIPSLRGQAYDSALSASARGDDVRDMFDVGNFYFIVRDNWRDIFAVDFQNDRSVLSALSQIGNIRNAASHSQYGRDVRRETAMSRISDMSDILKTINAASAQAAVQEIWDGLDKMRVSTPAPAPDPSPAAAPSASQPAAADTTQPAAAESPKPAARRNGKRPPLKAWREVIQPREDVIGGDSSQSRFAASLSAVHSGRAGDDYANPFDFFRRTYVTDGIEALLVNALKRLSGNGGEPVIQTKTVFGGGKTHSLIALYHLISSGNDLISLRPDADEEYQRVSDDIREIIRKAGLNPDDGIPGKVAVIDCNEITATTTEKTRAGDPLNTLWGVIAYQLGGQEAYDIIGSAARGWTAPGTAELRRLFEAVSPCVILIDELVAYARNIPNDDDKLGKFYSFVQYLTEAARQSDRVALVITLPETATEAGTAVGGEALDLIEKLAVLDNIAARVEAVWHPLEARETFEVIRRRLFEDAIDEAERDRVCDTFADMYRKRRADYPPEAAEAQYRERLRQCYPVHPEFFDRVFSDWSADPRFQRTRGALRVMASAISRLYARQDSSSLIMPADAPLSDRAVSDQFVRLLDDNWGPALEEIDSDNGKLDAIDAQDSAFREIGGASRRLARAIFLGSKPGRAARGIDREHVNLAAVRPYEGAATYRDALSRMVGDLYYLYEEEGRFFFHNEENLNRLAADRAREMTESQVQDAISELLKNAVPRERRAAVEVCPANPAAVPDADRARLVVLPPSKAIPSRRTEDGGDRDAGAFALDMLLNARADAPRIRKNALLFLTARRDDVRDVERKTRVFLAWESIVNAPVQILNLSRARRNLATDNMGAAKNAMDAALKDAYVRILAPEQPDGGIGDFELAEHRITPSGSGEIIESAFAILEREELLLTAITPRSLLGGINQTIWLEEHDHIAISALWDSLANYVHAPFRLADVDVLIAAIAKGVEQSLFGYAPRPGYDSEDLYPGIVMGETTHVSPDGFIVRQEMARMVLDERDKQKQGQPTDPTQPTDIYNPPGPTILTPPEVVVTKPNLPTQITITKTLDAPSYITDIAMISGEIVRNLFEAGEGVEITIEITAKKPNGFPEQTTRPTRENSEQLGLDYNEK